MCFRFIPNSPITAALRGEPVFKQDRRRMKALNLPHGILLPGDRSWQVGDDWALDLCPTEIWFILMPGFANTADMIEERRKIRGAIVDYHADVLHLVPRDDASPQAKKAGDAVPQETWEWWHHPDRQDAMTRSLTGALVITTPWPELIPALKTRFERPVVHLPDTHPKDRRAFKKAWNDDVNGALREIWAH